MVVWLVLKPPVSFLRVLVKYLQPAAMGYKNSIPDRWTEYIPVGRRIPGTRFITFKVPLKQTYDDKLEPPQRFSPSDLIKEVEKQNEELGLIVDLTCTKRYYSKEELPNTIMYAKIFTIGHQVPSDDVIAQFKCVVKQYLSQNSENDKLVGVHCTHGLNRTGYLVCRYLIDLQSMEPSEAIEKFNSSRGHNIERRNYLDDLLHGKSRSNAGLDKPQDVQHFSGMNVNSLLPPYPEEQPQSYGHSYATPRWGPRFHTPPSGQPSLHHQEAGGPWRGVPHSGGRYPRGTNGHGHHPRRPFPQYYGAPPEDSSPPFSTHSDRNPGSCPVARFPRSQQHGNSNPYQRYPKPAHKKKPKTQWQ
ncbi:RNA/RNP complex-1-interacting phosphatase isoform X2 [Eleutherodactylus coqui]|uniref:RNA/RNP complex-1-interacting phosphatase isoform X2 n=1 Tax=Eleutherodactylus coqui TaxID=57060 RepID=UPI003463342E